MIGMGRRKVWVENEYTHLLCILNIDRVKVRPAVPLAMALAPGVYS